MGVEFSSLIVIKLDRNSTFSGRTFCSLGVLFILLSFRALSLLAHLNIQLIALNFTLLLVTDILRHVEFESSLLFLFYLLFRVYL